LAYPLTDSNDVNACSPEPEVDLAGRRSGDGRALVSRRKRKPEGRRDRRGRRNVAKLRDSRLPRPVGVTMAVGGRLTPEALAWLDYVGPLVDRLGLGRPVPAWSRAHLIEAGHSHLTLLKLRAAEAVETHPPEARRLRSEARRSASQRARAEAVLSKLVAEHRAHESASTPSFQALLAKVGQR
jgi:hypothetical protein